MAKIAHEDGDASFGFVLDESYTKKLIAVCNYMNKAPHDLVVESIDRLYVTYLKQVKELGR